MNNDKPVTMKELTAILEPLTEAVSRIDQSLWRMPQLQNLLPNSNPTKASGRNIIKS